MLIDEGWCRFLRKHDFLVDLSIDGLQDLNDAHRRGLGDRSALKGALGAARLLHHGGAEFNTLTVVNRTNAPHPLRVYRFLRKVVRSRHVHFIPCVEPLGFEDQSPRSWVGSFRRWVQMSTSGDS